MNQLIKDKIEVLEKAKEFITTGEYQYICYALESIEIDNKQLVSAVEYLKGYVTRSLKGQSTLRCWQIAFMTDFRGVTTHRMDRLAWIDWMINCYKEDNP